MWSVKDLQGDAFTECSTAIHVSSSILQNYWISLWLQSLSNEFKQMRQIWIKYSHEVETAQEEGPWSVYTIVPILLFPKYLQFCMPKGEHMNEECERVFKTFWYQANSRPCLWFGLKQWVFVLYFACASVFLRACLRSKDCSFAWSVIIGAPSEGWRLAQWSFLSSSSSQFGLEAVGMQNCFPLWERV